MASGSEVRAGGAFVEFFAKDGPLRKSLADMEGRLKSFANASMRFAAIVFAAGVGIAAPLNRGIESLVAAGNALFAANRRTGASVEELGALAYATNSSVETVANGIQGVTRVMQDVIEGSGEAADMLHRMGTSLEELQGLSESDRLKKIADGLLRIGNVAQRAQFQERLGLGGMDLTGGSAGVAQREQRGRDMGIVLSAEDVAKAREFSMVWRDFKLMIESAWNVVGRAVIPAATRLFKIITEGVRRVRDFLAQNQRAIQILDAVSGGLMVGGIAVMGFAGAVYVLSGAMSVLGVIFSPIGIGLAAIGVLAYVAWQNWDQLASVIGSSGEWGALFKDLGETATATFQGINDALAANNFELAARIGFLGIKIAWLDTTQVMKSVWTEMINFIATWLARVVFGWQVIFEVSLRGLRTAWSYVVQAFVSGWNRFRTEAEVALAIARAVATLSNPATAAREAMAAGETRQRQINEAATTERNEISGDSVMRLQALRRDLTTQEEVINSPDQNAAAAARAEQTRLRTELAALNAQAAAEAANNRRGQGLRGVPAEVERMTTQATVMGTFSAEAVRGMDSGPMNRIADNTRRANELLEAIARELARAAPLMMA